MRPRWEREDLHDAARRGLLFDPQQAERLRREVNARTAAQLAVANPASVK